MTYDSNYSILRDILVNKLGGDDIKYDSCYSILIAICNKLSSGGGGIVVDLPATVSDEGSINIDATVTGDGVINL